MSLTLILRSTFGSRLTAVAPLLVAVCLAETPRSATDEQVRPVLLYRVAQYVTWPQAQAGEPLRFCIFDDPALADALTAVVRGKSIQDRKISVAKVKSTEELAGCHVAFIGVSRQKPLRELFARWAYPPILIVGEADGFAELGGMINLKVADGRVALQINIENTEKAGLKVRSQLLQLAQIVAGKKP